MNGSSKDNFKKAIVGLTKPFYYPNDPEGMAPKEREEYYQRLEQEFAVELYKGADLTMRRDAFDNMRNREGISDKSARMYPTKAGKSLKYVFLSSPLFVLSLSLFSRLCSIIGSKTDPPPPSLPALARKQESPPRSARSKGRDPRATRPGGQGQSVDDGGRAYPFGRGGRAGGRGQLEEQAVERRKDAHMKLHSKTTPSESDLSRLASTPLLLL